MRGRRGHAWFPPQRLPGYLGVVDVTRLLVLEAVVVLLVFVSSQHVLSAIIGGVLVLLTFVVLLGRTDGRWGTEHGLLWLRFRRRRGAVGEKCGDPRLAGMRYLAPDLTVEDIDGTGGTRLGMGSDGAGWFAVLELEPVGEGHLRPPVPLVALVRVAAEAEQPGAVVQVVSHSRPSTERGHTVWVSVRLDAHAVAESVIDAADNSVDVPTVLAELIRRVGRVLRRRDMNARVLDADELIDALVRSCDLLPVDRSVHVHEEWNAWHSVDLAHACYWLEAWPHPEVGIDMLAALAGIRVPLVSTAVLLEPQADGANLRCLVRLAAPPAWLPQVCDRAEGLAERAGARLRRLNGEHAPAVYASAPTGGGAR